MENSNNNSQTNNSNVGLIALLFAGSYLFLTRKKEVYAVEPTLKKQLSTDEEYSTFEDLYIPSNDDITIKPGNIDYGTTLEKEVKEVLIKEEMKEDEYVEEEKEEEVLITEDEKEQEIIDEIIKAPTVVSEEVPSIDPILASKPVAEEKGKTSLEINIENAEKNKTTPPLRSTISVGGKSLKNIINIEEFVLQRPGTYLGPFLIPKDGKPHTIKIGIAPYLYYGTSFHHLGFIRNADRIVIEISLDSIFDVYNRNSYYTYANEACKMLLNFLSKQSNLTLRRYSEDWNTYYKRERFQGSTPIVNVYDPTYNSMVNLLKGNPEFEKVRIKNLKEATEKNISVTKLLSTVGRYKNVNNVLFSILKQRGRF